MKYLIPFLLFSSQAFAWEIVLDRTNHVGVRNIDVLKFEKGEHTFNGKNLGSTLPKEIQNSWKDLEQGPEKAAAAEGCPAGNYTYLKKEGSKQTLRQGCTQGKAYGALIQNLDEIREYAKAKSL